MLEALSDEVFPDSGFLDLSTLIQNQSQIMLCANTDI